MKFESFQQNIGPHGAVHAVLSMEANRVSRIASAGGARVVTLRAY